MEKYSKSDLTSMIVSNIIIYQSSNVSVRPNSNQILFYGNSAMEFRQSFERLESAFIQESCRKLISNGNLVPDINGVYLETRSMKLNRQNLITMLR